MRAFFSISVWVLAPLSLAQLVKSAAIPRSLRDPEAQAAAVGSAHPSSATAFASPSTPATSRPRSNSRVFIFNDGDRPRWGFAIPQPRAAPVDLPAPPQLVPPPSTPKSAPSTTKATTSKDKTSPTSTDQHASPSTASHKNHSKHVPGSHEHGSSAKNKGSSQSKNSKNSSHRHGSKGGKQERRSKMDKNHKIVKVAIGSGRYGHSYVTSLIVARDRSTARLKPDEAIPVAQEPTQIQERDLVELPTSYRVAGIGTTADVLIPVVNNLEYASHIVKRSPSHDHDHHRRDFINLDVPGTVDIKTTSASPPLLSGPLQLKLASLVLGVDPSTNASFVLSATNNTATPIYLHVNPNSNITAPADNMGNPSKVVSLRIPVFDRTAATEAEYCAQFDASPLAAVPLTAELCLDDTSGSTNTTNGNTTMVSAGDVHASQSFAYTPATGAITPIWLNVTDSAPPLPATSAPLTSTTSSNTPAASSLSASPPAITISARAADCENATSAFTQLDALPDTNNISANNSANPNIVGQPQSMSVMMYFTPLTSAEVYSVEAASDTNNSLQSAESASSSTSQSSAPPSTSAASSTLGNVDTTSTTTPVSNIPLPSSPVNPPAPPAPPSPLTTPCPSAPTPGITSATPSPPVSPTGVPVVQANALPASSAPAPSPPPVAITVKPTASSISASIPISSVAAVTYTITVTASPSPTSSSLPSSTPPASPTSPSPTPSASTTLKPADAGGTILREYYDFSYVLTLSYPHLVNLLSGPNTVSIKRILFPLDTSIHSTSASSMDLPISRSSDNTHVGCAAKVGQFQFEACLINTLPPELLREIFLLIVANREDYNQILKLSRVCVKWRGVISDVSELFTLIPWEHWSSRIDLVRLWRRWARDRPHTLRFTWSQQCRDAFQTHHRETPDPYLQELEACLPNCQELCVNVDVSSGIIDLLDFLGLRQPFPGFPRQTTFHKLSRLEIRDIYPSTLADRVNVKASQLPALRELRTDKLLLVLQGGDSVRRFFCGTGLQGSYDWASWARAINRLRNLESLTLHDFCSEIDNVPSISLPNLREIELFDQWKHLERKLLSFEAPSLTTITLRDIEKPLSRILWLALDRAFPTVTTLKLITTLPKGGEDILEHLVDSSTMSTSLLFPLLSDIVVMGGLHDSLLKMVRQLVEGRQGIITHLTLPPGDEHNSESLESTFIVLRHIVPNFAVIPLSIPRIGES
ncbi:hypothetical protein DL93DRAFT_2192958 [Clavulina sp. PMI_390]|nr:hypothetical protein DL93DRAFT_2192958 [Clavulina sp. PMI_390]